MTRGCVQEYYAAQCANTKLSYEKKQLERTRDQLLRRWRMHDAATCRHSSPRSLHAAAAATAAAVPSEFDLDLFSSSTLGASSTVASGSAAAVDEPGGNRAVDIDDDKVDSLLIISAPTPCGGVAMLAALEETGSDVWE